MNRNLWNLYLGLVHGVGFGDIKAWTKLELTMSQLKVIMLLSHYNKLTVGELAEKLNVSLPNMTGIIDRLNHHELIKRVQSNDDRRVYLIELTEKAIDVFTELNNSSYEEFKRIENLLSQDEKIKVKEGFEILLKAIHKSKV